MLIGVLSPVLRNQEQTHFDLPGYNAHMSKSLSPTYVGTVETDSFGYAEVELPTACGVGRRWHYQLSIVDDGPGFPQAKVADEPNEHSFTVRSSEPFVRVCWQARPVAESTEVSTWHATGAQIVAVAD